ncbi:MULTISPECIES: hypothetical protein [Pseudomonas]|uniref:Uncharacterized protein n=1 Tax=Pseudomonas spirodelae TaxID=3101751 RepID=A0ABU5PBR5_9PSED|nr:MULTISPECIES: hypothetical protein [unclassified Pseudomonas]MBU0901983.1 hypothetical protein [Gammaproteobacteria bacterium]MDD2160477.1 hypothetical protein [Pseudomonas sp. MIL19]MEA1607129.1 hypothetical protein [Pseudomonas sp. T5W1]|tara:strand:- start:58 stop:489 length:432 start_codon:yes stop_codon:yes gene_type:complete
MRGSELEGEQHSTDPRPRPWVRVIGSLALFGFLIGLMIGRLFQPDPLWLERVEVREQGLELWFNVEPVPREEHAGGVFILRLESFGREQQGQLQVQGRLANWRLQRERKDLLLRVLAARPLRGEWRAEEVDGRWRLLVSLVEQ